MGRSVRPGFSCPGFLSGTLLGAGWVPRPEASHPSSCQAGLSVRLFFPGPGEVSGTAPSLALKLPTALPLTGPLTPIFTKLSSNSAVREHPLFPAEMLVDTIHEHITFSKTLENCIWKARWMCRWSSICRRKQLTSD